MAISEYQELVDNVSSWLDRDDLTSQIDNFIQLAESRHKREVRFRDMIKRQTLSIANRYVDLPVGYLEAKTLRILTDPVTVVKSVNLHEMNRRRREVEDTPAYFTTHEQIEFDVTPDEAYTGEIIYFKALTGLSSSNTKNALLTEAPDVYLYSTLAATAPFLADDARIATWETLYQNAKNEVNELGLKEIGPLVSRVSGPTP